MQYDKMYESCDDIAPSGDELNHIGYSQLKETLSVSSSLTNIAMTEKPQKVPRRILHFSDGTLEEYSTDEEDLTDNHNVPPPVDPKTLTWPKWCLHHASSAASKTLAAADYCGEKLAWFFGITSPKYQYILDEYQRRLTAEREEAEREMEEEARERKRIEEQRGQVAVETCYNVSERAEASKAPKVTKF